MWLMATLMDTAGPSYLAVLGYFLSLAFSPNTPHSLFTEYLLWVKVEEVTQMFGHPPSQKLEYISKDSNSHLYLLLSAVLGALGIQFFFDFLLCYFTLQLWQCQNHSPAAPGWGLNPCLCSNLNCCSWILNLLCHSRNSWTLSSESSHSFWFMDGEINWVLRNSVPCPESPMYLKPGCELRPFWLFQSWHCLLPSFWREKQGGQSRCNQFVFSCNRLEALVFWMQVEPYMTELRRYFRFPSNCNKRVFAESSPFKDQILLFVVIGFEVSGDAVTSKVVQPFFLRPARD